jgi:peptidoglycan DL-endopeptidase CwlO
VSVDQAKAGTAVAGLDQARPGDLVFWYADGTRPNHIGIYAGDGQMLVAPRTGDVVRYQQLTRAPHEIRRVS